MKENVTVTGTNHKLGVCLSKEIGSCITSAVINPPAGLPVINTWSFSRVSENLITWIMLSFDFLP